ncbi:TonB-dependent receptor [Pedobacter sp. MC2016-14]|uniref:TonB-dependent receptor n=1 Tax=Pedobacter sp. MC2016-14 TaxID=2897327 RepID=UPI001E4E82C6|nr:TonB-dependent receptor [Pedobacter sp. MC2016-14]MCD0488420.1 TonB-dependent receptor [Pedobacter sp. MC2016-14]
MKRKLLCLVLCCLLFGLNSYAQQNGTVKGKVLTLDGKPAENISVRIVGTSLGASTNEYGEYKIGNVKPGTYTLKATAIGLQTHEESVTVTAKGTASADFTISANFAQLQEVNVSTGKNKFTNKKSQYVAKMPLNNLENPQVYSVISKELLADQVITSYDDALKNAPGLNKLWSSTGRGSDGAGYFSLRGFAVQPTLVNGLPGLTNGSLDVSNVERIEVVKGPSGTLFGSSVVSYGGLINTVTKQPFAVAATEVTYTAGSYGLNRLTADVNAPLDAEGKLLLRVNAAYTDQNSWQDAGFSKTRFFAPSLAYKLNDKVSFLLNAQFLSAEGTNPTMLFFNRSVALKSTSLEQLGYNPNKSYTSNDITIKTPVISVQAQMNWKISEDWNSQTIVSRGSAQADGFYSYLFESATAGPNPLGTGIFNRLISDQNSTTQTTDIQQNFIGDFSIGGLRNRVVAGLDYFNRTVLNSSSGYAPVGAITLGPAGTNTGNLTRQGVDAAIAGLGSAAAPTRIAQDIYSAYISDVINFTPELSGMASVRIDRFQNSGLSNPAASKYGQTAVSPKFGLVYQVLKDQLSVFGNYMNGFKNAAPRNTVISGIAGVKTFDPEQANQWEAGIKSDLFDGKLSGSLSYYNIKVSNTILSLSGTADIDFSQGGNQYSKGFDAQITANPFPGFNIIASYTKNKNKLTNTGTTAEGRRYVGAGPENLANAWLSYKIMTGTVKGLGFGFGGNYQGKNMIVNDRIVGVFTLPSNTVLNASVSYATGPFNFALKVNNLTDKDYYQGWTTLEPMQPRTVAGSISYKF